MIEMELSKIIIDEKRHDQVVVLKEKNGTRILPIVVGFLEASSIKMKVAGVKPPRPLTHDLLSSVIASFGGVINQIIIDRLEDHTFHAKLVLRAANGENKIVDARPSDCIALAVRVKAPIFVEEEVLKQSVEMNNEK